MMCFTGIHILEIDIKYIYICGFTSFFGAEESLHVMYKDTIHSLFKYVYIFYS